MVQIERYSVERDAWEVVAQVRESKLDMDIDEMELWGWVVRCHRSRHHSRGPK